MNNLTQEKHHARQVLITNIFFLKSMDNLVIGEIVGSLGIIEKNLIFRNCKILGGKSPNELIHSL